VAASIEAEMAVAYLKVNRWPHDVDRKSRLKEEWHMRRPGREMRRVPPAPTPAVDGMPFTTMEGDAMDRMILSELEKVPDIRAELVQGLRLAIEENRYFVPGERVAESMIYRHLADMPNQGSA
jgi:hypothetical protein